MKKYVAALLAAVMIVSLASVAFAAKNEVYEGVVSVDPTMLRYDRDGTPPFIPTPRSMGSMTIGFGEVAYYALLTEDEEGDPALISNSEMVDGLKVKVDYEQGEEHIASVSIVKVRVDAMDASPFAGHYGNHDSAAIHAFKGNGGSNPGQGPGYYYFIAMQTIPRLSTSDVDVIGTFTLNKSKRGDDQGKDYRVKDLEVDFTANIFYPYNYLAFGENNEKGISDFEVTDDSVIGGTFPLKPDDHYLLKYDYDDEVEFEFGIDPNEGTFTVDVSGQGKNMINYTTTPNEALCAANPDATLWFLNFNGARFHRTGEFVYEADELNYAYEQMSDGSLKLLGEFEGGEVSFRTRVLGRYVFSDVELAAAPAAEAAA